MKHKTSRHTTTPPSPDLLARFAAIVGAGNAIPRGPELAPYLTEWRDRYHGQAVLALKPGSVKEVSAILALANETGTSIVPQGGNTGLVGGQIPWESGHEILLLLHRLNRVRARDPEGGTLTVEAGLTLQQVQEEAEKLDRIFPLSLASQGSCQIGGNLATNAGGVGVLAYGTMRDLTLGLEVVLPDGQVWNGLRALRKDNTGYDLRDLFIGSEGTLGVITAAVLRLFPRPADRATVFLGLESLEDMAATFSALSDAFGPLLTAFEMLPQQGLAFVMRHGDGVRFPLSATHPWYALVEMSFPKAVPKPADSVMAELQNLMEQGSVADGVLATSLAQAQGFWRLRSLMSEVQKLEGGSIKHDVSVPLRHIPAFITEANAEVTRLVPRCRPVPFGHFGDGNIHYNVSQPPDMDKAAFLAQWDRVSEAVHALVAKYDGSISAEHGIGRMKRDLLPQVKPPLELEIMRQLKGLLDPKNILNPGKLL